MTDVDAAKLEQIMADIENKRADTRYKNALAFWEPWKVFTAMFTACAAFFAAGIAFTKIFL
jgi:hypothetical protein